MRLFAAIRPDARALDHLAGALVGAGVDTGGAHGGPPPLRVVPAEQQHVTLAFYGEVPGGAVDDLAAALRAALAPGGSGGPGGPGDAGGPHSAVPGSAVPGSAVLAGAGVFSSRVLWVGVRDEPAGLVRSLAIAAADAAGNAGLRLPDEDRPRFRAHLTVARLSPRGASHAAGRERRAGLDRRDSHDVRVDRRSAARGVVRDALRAPAHALAVYLGPSWPVREVELVASRLGEGPGGGPAHEVLVRVAL